MSAPPRKYRSHGTGRFEVEQFRGIGEGVVFEEGVRVFHPENISLGSNVYVGHDAFLKGYYKNEMRIGSNTWIGQCAFLHSAGGLTIGEGVGIGPHVKMLTHTHVETDPETPVVYNESVFKAVTIEDGCDIGIGATILPGVTIGRMSLVGAGAVVTSDVPPYSVVAGVPARVIRDRKAPA